MKSKYLLPWKTYKEFSEISKGFKALRGTNPLYKELNDRYMRVFWALMGQTFVLLAFFFVITLIW